jgi:hypothetical protein
MSMKTSLWLVILCGSFVACGGSKEAAPEADVPTTPSVTNDAASDMPPATDATAAAATPEPAPAPAPEAAPITVGAFKLAVTGKKPTTIDVGADGVAKVGKEAKTLKFVKNTLQDDAGQWVARVNADGTIEVRAVEREMKDGKVVSEKERVDKIGKFVDGDAIETDKGKLTLGDDGLVSVTKTGATKPEPAMKEMKFSGVKPETKRAALVLFVGLTAATTQVTETSKANAPADPKAGGAAPPPADAKAAPKK